MNKITLSGLAGSGKTTIGKLLAKELNWEFISIGNFSREYAEKNYEMDINTFQVYCKNNPNIDIEIDNHFSEVTNQKSNIIIDYRLGYYFVKNALNVFLHVSEEEASKRLLRANRIKEFEKQSVEHIRVKMNERNYLMQQRFLKTYNTDFTNTNNYELVINTDNFNNFEDIVCLIINKINI